MTAENLLVAIREGALEIEINRPEKRNALSRPVLEGIGRIFRNHAGDEGLRLAILKGAGERSFAAGGDLSDLASVKGADAAETMAREAKDALAAIREFPLPVVAGLNGDALGGGAELAVACDMRVAAAHARIGFIQGRLAISSAWGGGVDLMRLVGSARGLRLLARSELVPALEAQALGLVDAVATDEQSLDEAIAEFVAPMRAQAPQVMRAFKALAIELRCNGRSALDEIETRHFGQVWAHPDHDRAVTQLLNRKR
jgi:enoyl-CoA hydratase